MCVTLDSYSMPAAQSDIQGQSSSSNFSFTISLQIEVFSCFTKEMFINTVYAALDQGCNNTKAKKILLPYDILE